MAVILNNITSAPHLHLNLDTLSLNLARLGFVPTIQLFLELGDDRHSLIETFQTDTQHL